MTQRAISFEPGPKHIQLFMVTSHTVGKDQRVYGIS